MPTHSTTHTCSGEVIGSGMGRKGGVVRWGTAGRMLAACGITVPTAGAVAGGAALLAEQGSWGVAVVAIVGLAMSGTIWVFSRRQKVDHTNVNDLPGTHDDERAEDPAGVVTAAMQAVAPPPTGGVRRRRGFRRAQRLVRHRLYTCPETRDPGFAVTVETNFDTGDTVIPAIDNRSATADATAVVQPLCAFDADSADIEITCDGDEFEFDPDDEDIELESAPSRPSPRSPPLRRVHSYAEYRN